MNIWLQIFLVLDAKWRCQFFPSPASAGAVCLHPKYRLVSTAFKVWCIHIFYRSVVHFAYLVGFLYWTALWCVRHLCRQRLCEFAREEFVHFLISFLLLILLFLILYILLHCITSSLLRRYEVFAFITNVFVTVRSVYRISYGIQRCPLVIGTLFSGRTASLSLFSSLPSPPHADDDTSQPHNAKHRTKNWNQIIWRENGKK